MSPYELNAWCLRWGVLSHVSLFVFSFFFSFFFLLRRCPRPVAVWEGGPPFHFVFWEGSVPESSLYISDIAFAKYSLAWGLLIWKVKCTYTKHDLLPHNRMQWQLGNLRTQYLPWMLESADHFPV